MSLAIASVAPSKSIKRARSTGGFRWRRSRFRFRSLLAKQTDRHSAERQGPGRCERPGHSWLGCLLIHAQNLVSGDVAKGLFIARRPANDQRVELGGVTQTPVDP